MRENYIQWHIFDIIFEIFLVWGWIWSLYTNQYGFIFSTFWIGIFLPIDAIKSIKVDKFYFTYWKSKQLSQNATDMIKRRHSTYAQEDWIKERFNFHHVQAFEKVVEFQQYYGGCCCKVGKKYWDGFNIDLFYLDKNYLAYKFRDIVKENEKYFFQCMTHYNSKDKNLYIDELGKIYIHNINSFIIKAENIEEFLDDEAIKYSFVKKQREWLSLDLEKQEIDEIMKNNEFIKIERKTFSDKYFEWWKDSQETVFIRIDLTAIDNYATIYCKDTNILGDLYKGEKAANIYPPHIKPNKKLYK